MLVNIYLLHSHLLFIPAIFTFAVERKKEKKKKENLLYTVPTEKSKKWNWMYIHDDKGDNRTEKTKNMLPSSQVSDDSVLQYVKFFWILFI